MLRKLVLAEHLHPPQLMQPWLFPLWAGWLWLHHGCVIALSGGWFGGSGAVELPYRVGYLLAAILILWLVWALLVQLRRIDPRGGTGFILAGFGLYVIEWVDLMAARFVEWAPHYVSGEQFGQTEAALCIGAGYVAFAVGVGLVIGDAAASWRAGPGAEASRTTLTSA